MIVRYLLMGLGLLFTAIAIVGVILPGLPAFPFVVLATACFSRSSERFHNWLLENRLLGPVIRDWQQTRSMPRKAKIMAIGSIVLGGGYSIVFMIEQLAFKLVMLSLLMVPIIIITRIPTTEDLCPAEVEE